MKAALRTASACKDMQQSTFTESLQLQSAQKPTATAVHYESLERTAFDEPKQELARTCCTCCKGFIMPRVPSILKFLVAFETLKQIRIYRLQCQPTPLQQMQSEHQE